jgi:antitoxin component YwqK of YwqJK toxin-antitoxin module/uncharacterized protein YqcC (DUF446 family)
MASYKEVFLKINEIEAELKRLNRWQSEPLPDSAYEDMGPFGMNSISPEQWIQFVLIPRVEEIIASRGEFPKESQVGVWALQNLAHDNEADRLCALLGEFDELIEGGVGSSDEDEPAVVKPAFNPAFGPDKQPGNLPDPLQFLESLKRNPREVMSIIGEAPAGWFGKKHVEALLELLGSQEPASPVHEQKCPSLPEAPSTVGRQAAFLLLGYIRDRYPPAGNSSLGVGGMTDDEIRRLTAERLQGKPPKRDQSTEPFGEVRIERKYDERTQELLSEMRYVGKLLNGESKTYMDGVLHKIETFRNGVLHGPQKLFWPDGKLMSLHTYKDNELDGLQQDFNKAGVLVREEYYEKRKLAGPSKEFYEDGTPRKEGNYRNGKSHGEFKEYWRNGKLKILKTYQDGELEGPWREHRDDGTLEREQTCYLGQLEGPQTWYHRNGKPETVIHYKAGKRHGAELTYRENGELKNAFCYQNGQLVDDVTLCGLEPPKKD